MLNHDPRLATLMAALADPTRLAMIERLSVSPRSVSELAEPFGLSLAAIVQHVQVLEKAGAIKTSKEGRTRRCAIDPAGMALLKTWISDRERFWQAQFDKLAAFLDKKQD